jgi:hypothetical protein
MAILNYVYKILENAETTTETITTTTEIDPIIENSEKNENSRNEVEVNLASVEYNRNKMKKKEVKTVVKRSLSSKRDDQNIKPKSIVSGFKKNLANITRSVFENIEEVKEKQNKMVGDEGNIKIISVK